MIVANQNMRNAVLIPKNAGLECDINNHAYCILERIGRARYFGEATSGPFSLNDFVKDSKLLHYFRNLLLSFNLVTRQQIQTKIRGQTIACQLFSLPRFHIVVQVSNMSKTEQLFEFLKQRPNHVSSVEDVKKLFHIQQKAFVAFIRTRNDIFKYEPKCPYREVFPNSPEKNCINKNKSEKTVSAVKLIEPDIDIYTLWNMEDDVTQEDHDGFLDISNQQFNRPLTFQVTQKIAESGKEGMSQHEIGQHFGLSRLNARSVLRKLQREGNISFFMKDEGRQRVSK